jgi:hypothetical protein
LGIKTRPLTTKDIREGTDVQIDVDNGKTMKGRITRCFPKNSTDPETIVIKCADNRTSLVRGTGNIGDIKIITN